MTEAVRVTYVCSQCGAKDHDCSATPPQVLNCWNCRAGLKREIGEMLALHVGMFPEVPQETAQNGDLS